VDVGNLGRGAAEGWSARTFSPTDELVRARSTSVEPSSWAADEP